MRYLFIVLLLLVAGCSCSTGPTNPDVAVLSDGWWYVTLSNGAVCIARPYQEPIRDTAEEAIAECRGK